MSLREGPLVPEATGQHTTAFIVTNRGASTCTLRGYPRIVLLAGNRRVLPFAYTRNGDQMITKHRPNTVRVLPGRSAFFAINKYRCDIHAVAGATIVRVLLPGAKHWLQHGLNPRRSLDYCPAELPSRTIAVSPIVGRYLDVFRR
jgi:hypothetical protein